MCGTERTHCRHKACEVTHTCSRTDVLMMLLFCCPASAYIYTQHPKQISAQMLQHSSFQCAPFFSHTDLFTWYTVAPKIRSLVRIAFVDHYECLGTIYCWKWFSSSVPNTLYLVGDLLTHSGKKYHMTTALLIGSLFCLRSLVNILCFPSLQHLHLPLTLFGICHGPIKLMLFEPVLLYK